MGAGRLVECYGERMLLASVRCVGGDMDPVREDEMMTYHDDTSC